MNISLTTDFIIECYLLLFNKHVLSMFYVPGFLTGAVQRLKVIDSTAYVYSLNIVE